MLSVNTGGMYYSNLSSSELSALNNLKYDGNIVIKEGDKGSAVVVWDRGDYIEAANRQLGDLFSKPFSNFVPPKDCLNIR